MGELETNNPPFEVEVSLNGNTQTVSVKPEETSDGDTYYSCTLAEHEVTQIRSDEKDQWEQLWGKLPQQQVDAIGKAIKARL